MVLYLFPILIFFVEYEVHSSFALLESSFVFNLHSISVVISDSQLFRKKAWERFIVG